MSETKYCQYCRFIKPVEGGMRLTAKGHQNKAGRWRCADCYQARYRPVAERDASGRRVAAALKEADGRVVKNIMRARDKLEKLQK